MTSAEWGAGSTFDETYSFNVIGNIAAKNGTAYAYDATRPHQATGTPSVAAMSYDANGNRAARTTTQKECYSYNPLGQLVQVKAAPSDCGSPTKIIAYKYNRGGERVLKVPSAGDGGPLRVFSMYAESQDGLLTKHYYLGSRRIASQTAANASFSELPPGMAIPPEPIRVPVLVLASLGGLVLLLLIAPDRRRSGIRVLAPIPARAGAMAIVLAISTWPTQAMGQSCGGGGGPAVQHYHVDHLGSTLAMTNGAGALTRQIRYTAYGSVRGRFDPAGGAVGLTSDKRFEFTTYETEQETGLEYAHARYYDPQAGLFLSHDPAAQFANPYQYTAWDPVNASDPSGESVGFVLFVIGLVLAALQAIYTGITTGDWGAAIKGFVISAAIATVSYFAGPAIVGGICSALEIPGDAVAVAGGLGGGYQVVRAVHDGNWFGVASGLLAITGAAYAYKEIGAGKAASGVPNGESAPAPTGKTTTVKFYEKGTWLGLKLAAHGRAYIINPDGLDLMLEGMASEPPSGLTEALSAPSGASGEGTIAGDINMEISPMEAPIDQMPVRTVEIQGSFAEVQARAVFYAAEINAAGVRYNPVPLFGGGNSNSALWGLPEALGGPSVSPTWRAVGAGTPIPLK